MSHSALGPQWKSTGLPESGGTQPPKGNGGDTGCVDCGALFQHTHNQNELGAYTHSGSMGGGLAGKGDVWPHLDRAIEKQYGKVSPFGNPNN